MTIATHPVAPEEIMAWLDGELAVAEAESVAAHVATCAECAEIQQELTITSQMLSKWNVPEAPAAIEHSIHEKLSRREQGRTRKKPLKTTAISFSNWKLWAIGASGFVTALALLAVVAISVFNREDHSDIRYAQFMGYANPSTPAALNEQTAGSSGTGVAAKAERFRGGFESFQNGPLAPASPGPMIARTAALTILVKDFAAARGSLDSVIAKHGGYSANLTVDTPESGQRHFQASLRIPATELAPALNDLRTLGRTLNESQAGEEVTQQHADLVARLQNSRETEQRLRAILEQRTGKIDDVLHVEEEIARVRGEIESMEAEQKGLEHRVAFASVDLQLVEEYKERFNASPVSTSGRLHNAFVEGIRNASGTVLGLILFLEEFGPAILIWTVLLGVPAYFALRRYRKVQARF